MQPFSAEQFSPTQWASAKDKVHFARQFVKFVESDFDKRNFPKTFYVQLSMTFGHIAYFNHQGFFDTFFTSTEDKVLFLQMSLSYRCYGDPAFTYSDVERALQAWLREKGTLAKVQQRLAEETETQERALLTRLKTKYESAPV